MATLESLLIKIGIDPSSISSDMRDVGTEIRRGADRIDGTVPVTVDDSKVKGGLSDVESSVERGIRSIESDVPVDVDDSKVKGGLSDVESSVERAIRGIDGDVPVDVDDSKVKGGLTDVESSVERAIRGIDSDVPVDVDDSKVKGGLSGVESDVERKLRDIDSDVPVGVDNDKLKGDLDGVESAVERKMRDIDSDIPVGVDNDKLRGDLNSVESTVERKLRMVDADVPVGVDQDHVRRELSNIEDSVNRRVRMMDPDIEVDVDEDRVNRSFTGLSARLSTRAGALGLTMGSAIGRGIAGGIALAATAIGVGGALIGKAAFDEAQDAIKIGAQTEAVIKSTGQAANVTAGQVSKLAEALSMKAGVDDEEIQVGANMLLTFKNIHNEVGKGNDIFNQATKAVLDMSVAMDMPMKNAAIMLGKALNDPIAGLSAMSRVGITFTEQQEKQITALVESGNTMKAQKIILGELTSEFGGSAAAQATAADKAGVAWGNLMEKIGVKLMPVLNRLLVWFVADVVPALERFAAWFDAKVVPAIASFVSYIQANWPKISKTIETTMADVLAIVQGVITIIVTVWRKWGDDIMRFTKITFNLIADSIRGPLKIIRGIVDVFVGLLTGDWRRAWNGIKEIFEGAWIAIKAVPVAILKTIRELIRSGWDAVKDIFKKAWADIRDDFGGTWDKIRSVVTSGVDKVKSVVTGAWDKVRDATSAAWNKVRDVIDGVWDKIRGLVSNAADKVRDVVDKAWDRIRDVTLSAWNKVRDVIGNVWDKIRDVVSNAATRVREVISNAWDRVRDITSNLWTRIREVISNVWDRIREVVSNATTRVREVVSNAWDRVRDVTSNAWTRIRDVISNVWDRIRDVVSNATGRVRDVVTGAWDRLRDATSNIWGRIRDIISNVVDRVRDIIGRLKDAVGTVPDAFRKAKDAVGNVWSKIEGAVKAPVNTVIRILNTLIRGFNKIASKVPGIPEIGEINTFETGGYTGRGHRKKPAGIVHADEFVMSQPARKTLEQSRPGALDFMNRTGRWPGMGYADGGRVWPVGKGNYTTYPGHDGVDFPRPRGTPIHAAAKGTTSYVGWGRGYGRAVFERGPYGELVYGHMLKASTKKGQSLSPGEVIGYVDSTGNSSGNHLHFGFPGGTFGQALDFLRGASISDIGVAYGGVGAQGGGGISLPDWLTSLPGNILDAIKSPFDFLWDKISGPMGNLGNSWIERAVKGLPKMALSSMVDMIKDKTADALALLAMHGEQPDYDRNGAISLARQMVPYGWSSDPAQWSALVKLWDAESGWNFQANNPTSSAYGIPQALVALHNIKPPYYDTIVSKAGGMTYAGGDAATQIRWGINYIKGSYGNPVNAWNYWQKHHSYDNGGVLPPGVTMAVNRTGQNEYVHTAEQLAAMGNNQAIIDLLTRLVAAAENGSDVLIDGRILTGEVTRRQRADARGQRVAAGTAGWS